MVDFVKFGCRKLDIDDKGRKTPVGMQKWKGKTKEQYKSMYNPNTHKVVCVVTGKINNITVIDFDKKDEYYEAIGTYPQLKDAYTVETSKGFHIYCKYNKKQKTTTNKELGIDIRNDDAIAFGAGTQTEFNTSYDLLDNAKMLDVEMPMELYWKVAPHDKPKQKIKVVKKISGVIPSYDSVHNVILHKIVENIDTKYIENRNDWKQIVWAMRNEGFSKDECVALSKKAENYTDEGFENVWNYKSTAGVGTLKFYSRKSNEANYLLIHISENTYEELDIRDQKLAELFATLIEGDIIFQNKNLYVYEDNEWIVDDCGSHSTKHMLVDVMGKYFKLKVNSIKQSMSKLDEDDDDMDKFKKQLKIYDKGFDCIYGVDKQNKIINALKTILKQHFKKPVIFDLGKEQYNNIQFNNGVFELDTMIFRKRTKLDYITKKLDWDYNPDVSNNIYSFVEDYFKKIEPDLERREMILGYLRLSLTGNTSKQKMIMMIGYEASNGKSTLFKIMDIVFSIYVDSLDSETFSKHYQKKHKQLINLLENPIRFAYIEELDDTKIDVKFYKALIDGGKQNCEVLFGTKTVAHIQAKIMTSSNADPNVNMDKGVKRRMILEYLTSEFREEFTEDDWENRHFKLIEGFENHFEDDEYKNALFQLLIKYPEFNVPECVVRETEDKVGELYEFNNKFDMYYKITNDENDKVSLKGLTDQLKLPRQKILSEVRKMGKGNVNVKYDKNKTKNGVRGVIVGIREVDDEEEDEYI